MPGSNDCKDATNVIVTDVQQFPRLATHGGPDQSAELNGKWMITTLVATLCGEYRLQASRSQFSD
jgi:hypothetical protein